MTDLEAQLLAKRNVKEAVDIRINELNQQINSYQNKISRLESSAQNDNKIADEIASNRRVLATLKTTREDLQRQSATLKAEIRFIDSTNQ